MRCPRCQHENTSRAKFCEECAAPLARRCSSCGTELSPTAKFCPECASPAGAPAPAPPVASPTAYTPKHLADKILTGRSALEGERKQVTVLFCDIVDSSRLAERLDAEGMHEVMDSALRLMAGAVHRYEGTVNQFLGDGLMALFGAPVALEDHALRAVQSALAIRETISGLSEQLQRERGVELTLRLGLNTGLVVVGRIGDDLRMDYTAVGDTTHLAARTQALAAPGTILVTEATHRLVQGYVRSEPRGPLAVKGRSGPVMAWTVTGRRRARTRLEVSAERGLTRLVGRQRELGVLRDCLARARAGRGQAVGIVGEPGVGKSRLLHEFRQSLEGEPLTWVEGHCVAYGASTPYLPVIDLLRANFQVDDGDPPLQIREKLREGLRQLDPALEVILPVLGELFGLPGQEESLRHLDPKEKRRKTFEAIRALTMTGSQRRPHVIVVEDVHWIDRTSEDYLAFWIESLAGTSALLLTTHRPGYAVRWSDKTYYTQLALDLLSEDETEAMVTMLLDSHDLPREFLGLVRERAEGNPLFVEEVTAALLERGTIVRERDGLRWAGTASTEVPATIQDIIRARIDRLEEPVKRTVQTAAVIGREFGLRLLTRISEMAHEVGGYVDTLKHAELVHEKRFFPETEYIFKHAVTQDVAYQSLLAQRRKELHGAIGRAMEELHADRRDEHAALLAYHYGRSASPDKAVTYALLAGDRAARLYANAEAKAYFEQALATARSLPASDDARRDEIDAAVKLATVGTTRQDLDRDWTNLEAARALAEQLGDQPRLAQVLYWFGRLQYVSGKPREAVEYARQSIEIADRLGDDTLAAFPVNLMGRACFPLSDFRTGAPIMARSTEQMRRLGNKTEESTAAAFAGIHFGALGEFATALEHAEHGVLLAREIQNPFAEAAAVHLRGGVRVFRGEWAGAIEDCAEATRIAESAGDLFRVYIVKVWHGWALVGAGDLARGRTVLEDAIALSAAVGSTFQLPFAKAHLAVALMALDGVDGVPELCEQAIHLAEESDDTLGKALAQRVLGEAYAFLRPVDTGKAQEAILEAIRLLEQIGARPELARTYLIYARLLTSEGSEEKAREYLASAVRMFKDMGMASDLGRAEQALRGA